MKTTTRTCNKCETERPIEEFDKHKQSFEGRRLDCKYCRNELRRARYHKVKNTEEFQTKRANNMYKLRYGISLEQYDEMFKRQGGVCAVCNEVSKKKLCVDHDHETGAVRALVCDRCNRAMGASNDDAAILRLCAEYLESF